MKTYALQANNNSLAKMPPRGKPRVTKNAPPRETQLLRNDLIENIVLSGRAESITGLTGQPSLSFLWAMPEKEQKAVLHDLTVIKDPASKTVKHGIDMIRHWKAEGSFRSGMQSYMRETLEEEAIKVDEEERKAKLELLKVIISS